MSPLADYLPSGEMDRESGLLVQENPRPFYKAAIVLILELRPRQLPTIRLSCGNQSANISLINRRDTALSVFPSARKKIEEVG